MSPFPLKISTFLEAHLRLMLHPQKLFIKTLASGMDFLGWIHFSHHRVPRAATKRRMLKKLSCDPSQATVASYLGLLSHGNTHKLQQKILSDLASRGTERTESKDQSV
jgi:hypothetical protein